MAEWQLCTVASLGVWGVKIVQKKKSLCLSLKVHMLNVPLSRAYRESWYLTLSGQLHFLSSSACTRPLISPRVSPWTAVSFSCPRPCPLNPAAAFLTSQPCFLYLDMYFNLSQLPLWAQWRSPGSLWMRPCSTLMWGRHLTVITMHFQNYPECYQEEISSQLSYNLHSMNQPMHFWEGKTPQGLAQRNVRENHRAHNGPK